MLPVLALSASGVCRTKALPVSLVLSSDWRGGDRISIGCGRNRRSRAISPNLIRLKVLSLGVCEY